MPAAARAAGAASGVPERILSLWFGQAHRIVPRAARHSALSDPAYLKGMGKHWYFGGAEMDARCQPFEPLLADARAGRLAGREWESDGGLLALIILTDQLARNIHRGSARAFAWDDLALAAGATFVRQRSRYRALSLAERNFVAMPFMHSEERADHSACWELFEESKADFPACEAFTASSLAYLAEHTAVLDRFGRYPHRNAALGRASSAEEVAWLAEEAPGWARSQIANKPDEAPD